MTIISKVVFCYLSLLFAFSSSRADESAGRPGSQGEYLARAGDCVACHSVRGRQGLCRRPKNGLAARRDLLDQHHAGSRDRYRQI